MRVKTDSKRREILQASAAVFAEHGYHAATIAQIAAHMSSSKATIYNYFASKEELFAEMLIEAWQPVTAALLSHLATGGPFARRLERFARAYLETDSGDDAIAVMRLVVSEIGRSNIGERLSTQTSNATWAKVADHIRAAQEAGEIVAGDAEVMARQLNALLDGWLPMRLLLGMEKRTTAAKTRSVADEAVQCFLAAYGTRG